MKFRTIIALVVSLGMSGMAHGQQFNRLVSNADYASANNGRFVDLQPTARNSYQPGVRRCATGSNSYPDYRSTGYAQPISYQTNAYPPNPYQPASYAPVVPIANRTVASGGCYGGSYGTGYPNNGGYPSNGGYPGSVGYARNVGYASNGGYPAQYPYWTGNGAARNAYGDDFLGRNLFGAPTQFDRGEPVRNIFRWLLP